MTEFLRGKGRAVDAVLADAAAAHHDGVARQDFLALGRAPPDQPGNAADGSAVDQRLAEISVVETLEAAHPRDAALVAAVDHALVHAVADAARVHQALRQIAVVKRRAEAVAPRVANHLAAHARAHRVAIHADDAGDRAAVRIQRGGTVVGFDLVRNIVALVEADDARVVAKDRNQPVDVVPNFFRRVLDIRLEQRVDPLLAAVLVHVADAPRENLVLAVLRPGLGDALDLDVGRLFRQAERGARLPDVRSRKVVADRAHLLEAERQNSIAADFHQVRVRTAEVVSSHLNIGLFANGGNGFVDRRGGPLLGRKNADRLDQGVGDKIAGDMLGVVPRKIRPGQEILYRRVNIFLAAQLAIEHILYNGPGGVADVIGHTRLEAYFDQPVERRRRESAHGRAGDYRVRKRALHLAQIL